MSFKLISQFVSLGFISNSHCLLDL